MRQAEWNDERMLSKSFGEHISPFLHQKAKLERRRHVSTDLSNVS